MCFVQHAGDDGIQTNAFPGAGGAGHEQMRHAIQRGDEGLSGNRFAEGNGQWRSGLAKRVGINEFTQIDDLRFRVGQLDTNRGFARNRRDDTNAFGAHGQRQIIGERGDAAHFNAGIGLIFIAGNNRAGIDLGHIALHVKFGQPLFERVRMIEQFLARLHGIDFSGKRQQIKRWKNIIAGGWWKRLVFGLFRNGNRIGSFRGRRPYRRCFRRRRFRHWLKKFFRRFPRDDGRGAGGFFIHFPQSRQPFPARLRFFGRLIFSSGVVFIRTG
ncbi:MAG: hypothetical protein ALAOOOJD_00545 [bacterium]|nr:hypothetical protein [bacterium]